MNVPIGVWWSIPLIIGVKYFLFTNFGIQFWIFLFFSGRPPGTKRFAPSLAYILFTVPCAMTQFFSSFFSSFNSYLAKFTPAAHRDGGRPGCRRVSSLPANKVNPRVVRRFYAANGCRKFRRYSSPRQDKSFAVRLSGSRSL